MPTFSLFGYKFFFFSNEFSSDGKLEPVHIHVSDGNTVEPKAPKWWVGYGKCKIANERFENLSHYGLKKSDLKRIEEIICANSDMIIDMWYNFFKGYDIEIHNDLA